MDEIRVLLVEDNPVDAFMVRATLERSPRVQFVVSTAERLGAAIEQAAAEGRVFMRLDRSLHRLGHLADLEKVVGGG